jgi:hypothetical protein
VTGGAGAGAGSGPQDSWGVGSSVAGDSAGVDDSVGVGGSVAAEPMAKASRIDSGVIACNRIPTTRRRTNHRKTRYTHVLGQTVVSYIAGRL